MGDTVTSSKLSSLKSQCKLGLFILSVSLLCEEYNLGIHFFENQDCSMPVPDCEIYQLPLDSLCPLESSQPLCISYNPVDSSNHNIGYFAFLFEPLCIIGLFRQVLFAVIPLVDFLLSWILFLCWFLVTIMFVDFWLLINISVYWLFHVWYFIPSFSNSFYWSFGLKFSFFIYLFHHINITFITCI